MKVFRFFLVWNNPVILILSVIKYRKIIWIIYYYKGSKFGSNHMIFILKFLKFLISDNKFNKFAIQFEINIKKCITMLGCTFLYEIIIKKVRCGIMIHFFI